MGWAIHAYLEGKRLENGYESTLSPPSLSKLQNVRNNIWDTYSHPTPLGSHSVPQAMAHSMVGPAFISLGKDLVGKGGSRLSSSCLQITLNVAKRRSTISVLNSAAHTIWGETLLRYAEETLKLKASFVWDHGNFLHFPVKRIELAQKGTAFTYFKAPTCYIDRFSSSYRTGWWQKRD